MTTYKPGDILLVPFPFTDHTATKQRPAVVLSSELYNRSHPDLILAPITSKIAAQPMKLLSQSGSLPDCSSQALLNQFFPPLKPLSCVAS